MQHCKTKFKYYNKWFLFDLPFFEKRELILGICPKCKQQIAELSEVRKADGQVFTQTFKGKALKKIMNIEKERIIYTSNDILTQKKNLFGWVFGINKEIKNKIKQYSADFFGGKKVVKIIKAR